jgi:cystathionine gamma-lyase
MNLFFSPLLGLPSHPQHELAKQQQKGFGGMISFYIKGDLSTSERFFEHLSLFTLAESLGGIESLAELP